MTWKEATRLKSDIVCFQETHFISLNLPTFSHRNFPHVFMANGPKKKGGVAIAIRDTIPFSYLETHLDTSGRYIILVCEIFKIKYTLVNLYLLKTNQIRFLKKIWKKVESLKQGHVILWRLQRNPRQRFGPFQPHAPPTEMVNFGPIYCIF